MHTRLLKLAAPVTLLGLTIIAGACRSRSGDPGEASSSSGSIGVDAGGFDKASLLRSFGECTLGEYRDFGAAAVALDAATLAATPASREAAQTAWSHAMDIWQRAEVMQFGPAAVSPSPGARDMRNPVYAWPLFSRCLVEQTLVSKSYEAPGWAGAALVSTRSLAAAEYLLFYAGVDNACAPMAEINTTGAWAALGPDELALRRLAYAKVVTADVVERARALTDAWEPAKGNFLGDLATAGKGPSFTSEQMAFNAVTDAMFYVDLQLKNTKVGKPAGLVPDCAAPPCLASVESPWAKRSKAHIRANIAGYEKLFHGCGPNGEGLGFDDLLGAVGAAEIATKINASLVEVHASLDALTEPTFEDDLQKNSAGVKRLFDALRANSVAMKADFVTVLDLELPTRVEGDND